MRPLFSYLDVVEPQMGYEWPKNPVPLPLPIARARGMMLKRHNPRRRIFLSPSGAGWFLTAFPAANSLIVKVRTSRARAS